MLAAAVELARLVREQHNVTWSDTAAVDLYIERLQAAVQRLYRENNKLAAYHDQILQQVWIFFLLVNFYFIIGSYFFFWFSSV